MIRFHLARLLRSLANKLNYEGPVTLTIETPRGDAAGRVAEEIRFLDRRPH